MERDDAELAKLLKDRGNGAFRSGNYQEAAELFSEAIAKDPNNATLFCNRSMCRGSLGEWGASAADADRALELQPDYLKAHYWRIKSKIELKQLKEAQYYLLTAYSVCGSAKELKALEVEFQNTFGCSFKPKPTDFKMLEGLGEGNFSKIFKVEFKATRGVYALKVIEKLGADRIKRRHPNVHNEILMEKKILNKLSHPNIVMLLSTFQDEENLYYQMEYLGGGEVWSLLSDKLSGGRMVGCPRSLAKFILAEALNAIEYMHQHGVLHRDLKPENMMLTLNGHVKLVDFGSCKDLIDTSLNGPQFVGTPDYMSPETIRSKKTGPATDLWSFGVVAFQLLYGYTPFSGGSPYMTFLRIKRAMLRMPYDPALIPDELELFEILFKREAATRFARCTGSCLELPDFPFTPEFPYSSISYDTIRRLSFFSQDKKWLEDQLPDESGVIGYLKTLSIRPARRVPRLAELCLGSVERATNVVADAMSANGGKRPDVAWIRDFDLFRLPVSQRAHVAHLLHRCSHLHLQHVYRMLYPAGIDGLISSRLARTSLFTREYIGHHHGEQGHWDNDFFFTLLQDPLFGYHDDEGVKAEEAKLRAVITSVNRLRPRFVVVSGNLTADTYSQNEKFKLQLESVRRCLCRVSETIPLLFVPGTNTLGCVPTHDSIAHYNTKFGADFFGFFFGGFRCIVINSPLMLHPEGAPALAAEQDSWFEEEIEQAKLCATHVAIFSHHPWFLRSPAEPDSAVTMPIALRQKWLPKFQHSKVKYLFSSALLPESPQCTLENWELLGGLAHKKMKMKPSKIDAPSEDQVKVSGKKHSTADLSYEMKVVQSEGATSLPAEDQVVRPSELLAAAVNESSSSSDEECNEEDDAQEELTAEEDEFLNIDDSYEGPSVILTYPCVFAPAVSASSKTFLGGALDITSTITTPPLPPTDREGSVRVVRVHEFDVTEELYLVNELPKTIV